MKTDLQRTLELFKSFGIDCYVEQVIDDTTIVDLDVNETTISFEFDKYGKFKSVGTWE